MLCLVMRQPRNPVAGLSFLVRHSSEYIVHNNMPPGMMAEVPKPEVGQKGKRKEKKVYGVRPAQCCLFLGKNGA